MRSSAFPNVWHLPVDVRVHCEHQIFFAVTPDAFVVVVDALPADSHTIAIVDRLLLKGYLYCLATSFRFFFNSAHQFT